MSVGKSANEPENAASQRNRYSDGRYLLSNPDWHASDAPWKARQIGDMLVRNATPFSTAVEVGCGTGGVVRALAQRFPRSKFEGYDVSPDVARLWPATEPPNLSLHLADARSEAKRWDLLLLIDVFEHVEDYLGFLRRWNRSARYFIFHIPLELHVSALLRNSLVAARRKVGHLHHFSKATALATLEDTGFHVLESCYTPLALEGSVSVRSSLTGLANVPRRLISSVSADLAASLLGGYSLLVLAEASTPA